MHDRDAGHGLLLTHGSPFSAGSLLPFVVGVLPMIHMGGGWQVDEGEKGFEWLVLVIIIALEETRD